jgi:hypothetical protein
LWDTRFSLFSPGEWKNAGGANLWKTGTKPGGIGYGGLSNDNINLTISKKKRDAIYDITLLFGSPMK